MSKICVTHSGSFHADDVLSAVLLNLAGELDDYADIIRSRDEQDFAKADILFDVGGRYCPDSNCYDHHQRGQSNQFWDDGTPFSSAGLIWKAYADVICKEPFIQKQISEMWIRPVDAHDNGTLKKSPDNCRHISTIIGELNPRWNDDNADEDKSYQQACIIVEQLFRASLNSAKGNFDAYERVLDSIKKCAGQDVLILETYCPWKSIFHDLESKYSPDNTFKFIVYPTDSQQGAWKIFQVPVAKNTFEGRAYLPEAWGGLRLAELRQISGIADANFVHPNLFCGGAQSFAGVMAMADKSLKD